MPPVGKMDAKRWRRAFVSHAPPTVNERDQRRMRGAPSKVAVQVAVVDPLPLFRDGAVAALAAAGYAVNVPVDLVAWVRHVPDAVVVMTVQAEADWGLLAEAGAAGSTANSLVVLLEDDSIAAGMRAVRAGARSVLSRRVSAEVLQRTVSAVIDGHAVLPASVVATLAAGVGIDASPARTLSAERLSWLRALAAGNTVAELADQTGYSERAMFRLLRSLYRDMGVGGRIEALMRARDEGWL